MASPPLRILHRLLAYTWTSPNTLIGLLIGVASVCVGARVRLVSGAVEFSGGLLGRAVGRLSDKHRFCAITLGHTILGVCDETLYSVRAHEHVHIRQYECWGPLFVPAYLLAGLWQWVRGRHMYEDNPFEREAYGIANQGIANQWTTNQNSPPLTAKKKTTPGRDLLGYRRRSRKGGA